MKHRRPDNMEVIISFINDFYQENHCTPSARQISTATGIPRTTLQRMMRTMAENGMIEYDGETVATDRTSKNREETVSVGIIGRVPCGNLSLEEESIEDIVQLPTAIFGKGDLFLLYAEGNSMSGAGINSGDLVLIRRQEEANPGDIVVAYVEGMGNTLKTLRIRGGKAYLHPENPEYDDIPITECKIQGTAIKVIKNL